LSILGPQFTEIEALRARIAELEKIISGDCSRYLSLGITARDAVILGAFMRREALTYENISTIIVSDPLDDSGGLGWDAVRHLVWRLRRRLRVHDSHIEIRPVRQRRYYMPAASKAIIAELVKTR
jgi:hypothetical protein